MEVIASAEGATRPLLAIEANGGLFKSSQWWEHAYYETIPRTVRRIEQHLADGYDIVGVDHRIEFGDAEAAALRESWDAQCQELFQRTFPLEAAPPAKAVLALSTNATQLFKDRGIGVDEVLAVFLSALDGSEWDALPQLAPFRPEGSGKTVLFTELLDGILDRL